MGLFEVPGAQRRVTERSIVSRADIGSRFSVSCPPTLSVKSVSLVCNDSCGLSTSPYPLPDSTHHTMTGHDRIIRVAWPPIPSFTFRGTRCSMKISRGSLRYGSVFGACIVSGAPLIHLSPPLSRHPNAKRRIPSSPHAQLLSRLWSPTS